MTQKEIQEYINEREERLSTENYHGETKEFIEQEIEWLNELLEYTDDEVEYTNKVYREWPIEIYWDYEYRPFCKEYNRWFLIILDGFDEICMRCEQERKKALN